MVFSVVDFDLRKQDMRAAEDGKSLRSNSVYELRFTETDQIIGQSDVFRKCRLRVQAV